MYWQSTPRRQCNMYYVARKGNTVRQHACRHSAAYAPALLRLCSIIELRESRSLEAITAILGCPVWLPALYAAEQPNSAKLAPPQQRLLCQALWHTVNWLREVVSSFSADAQGYAGNLHSPHPL